MKWLCYLKSFHHGLYLDNFIPKASSIHNLLMLFCILFYQKLVKVPFTRRRILDISLVSNTNSHHYVFIFQKNMLLFLQTCCMLKKYIKRNYLYGKNTRQTYSSDVVAKISAINRNMHVQTIYFHHKQQHTTTATKILHNLKNVS